MINRVTRQAVGIAILAVAISSIAQSPASLANEYEALAQAESRSFAGFSATRGERLFQATHGGDWSCATCHTANPTNEGRHARTGKTIAPLAPAANAERFTDRDRTEKWFRRNCNDVLGRSCTAQEKGDLLAYLMSAR
jgi:hypothetical protein